MIMDMTNGHVNNKSFNQSLINAHYSAIVHRKQTEIGI